MPSLKSIKKRISSVKSTQKITKAMKMVAAAKLRRAQNATVQARHYNNACREMVARVAARAGDEAHPLFLTREKIVRKELWIFTSDRGLCGGFNSNLLRRTGDFLEEGRRNNISVACQVIGKKGRDYFKARNWPTQNVLTGVYEKIDVVSAEITSQMIGRFLRGEIDEVWMAFNRFQSALVQVVTFEKLLPLGDKALQQKSRVDYLYEPDRRAMLGQLVDTALTAKIRQVFLESMAAELAARMTAMDNATSNASDMISYLTLQYNRIRQATITKELMDIVNGAEALS